MFTRTFFLIKTEQVKLTDSDPVSCSPSFSTALYDVQTSLQQLLADISVAQHILHATTNSVSALVQYYHPLDIPHLSDTRSKSLYGLSYTQARALLMLHAVDCKVEALLRSAQAAAATLQQATSAQTVLWQQCQNLDVSAGPERPPAHALRFLSATLDTHQLWHHVSCLVGIHNVPLHLRFKKYEYIPQRDTAAQAMWTDTRDHIPTLQHTVKLCIWCRPQEAHTMLHYVPLLTLFAQAEFQGSMWALYATPEVLLTSISYLQYTRARTYFQRQDRSNVAHDRSLPDRASICRLWTHHIRNAHHNKKLGNWASAKQFRITYLPYDAHFSLTMIRGSSRLHQWDIGVPPPDECIYAILHMHMICIYIGRTHLPLIQRLRKHITTANAHREDCHLHQLLRSTNIEDWYIVPLEFVWSKPRVAIAERYWWDKDRR